jgi:hypothetical protein
MTHTRTPDGNENGGRRRSVRLFGQKKYAVIWLVGTVSAALVSYAGIRGIYSSDANTTKGDPAVRPAPIPPAMTTPAAAAGPTLTPAPRANRPPASHLAGVRIAAPEDEARVNGSVGVLLSGKYGDLRGAQMRIFVLAYNGQYYLIDNGPLLGRDRTWNFLVKPIGSGTTDIGRVFTIIVTVVNSSCQAMLEASTRDPNGNISFPILPAGCREADRVDVLKASF